MDLISLLKQFVTTCSRAISFGGSIQADARNRLISDLQRICSNVESAYSGVLARLRPIKDNFQNPQGLASELRSFAADSSTRDSFKPSHLCGDADRLLLDLNSNLDPLKYSIDVRKIGALRSQFQMIGNLDGALYDSYDEFARDLDQVATDITDLIAKHSTKRLKERSDYARHLITAFEDDLFDAIKAMRDAKDRILR